MPTIPYKHQTEAFEFSKNKDFFSLFMDMGTGKSKVIIMKLEYLISSSGLEAAIIIAPNYLKDTWVTDHFATHFNHSYVSWIYEGKITSTKKVSLFNDFCKNKKFKLFVLNVEAFQTDTVDLYIKAFTKCLKNRDSAMVVIDESTIIKNPDAKRTKKILTGFKAFRHKAILSGTPTPNSPADLYSQFDFLKTNFFNCSFFQFRHRHIILMNKINEQSRKPYNIPLSLDDFKSIKNALSKIKLTNENLMELAFKYNISEPNLIRINGMQDFCPYKDLDKLNKQISEVTFKVMKKDCLDLPDKIYEKILIDLNLEQKRMYKELVKDFLTVYKDAQLTVGNTLTLTTRLRMITGGVFPYMDVKGLDFDDLENFKPNQLKAVKRIDKNPKILAILEDIENAPNDTSIVIWSSFVEVIKYVFDELKQICTVATYFGETKDRESIIEKFKNKEIKVLICNPMTAGMGLNLQVSTLHYFMDNSYRADLRTQAEDRSHRIGQKNNVVYKDVIAKDTIDEKIYTVIKNKMSLLDYFKDKDALREFVYNIKDFK
jgi:SNF2 family DNA or RNA helicase